MIAKRGLGGRGGKDMDDAYAATVKDHGLDNLMDTRSIPYIVAKRLEAMNYDWAHFPECLFRDDPTARRWAPFQKVLKLKALSHNEAILDR